MRGALVLDFDGTVLDTEEPVFRAWAELWDAHGIELTLAEWQGTIGRPDEWDPWRALESRLGREIDPAQRDARRARRDELQAAHDVRPGILAWLDEAEELGVPVAIASSSSSEWVGGHLERLGIRHRFACLSCCEGDVPGKPDPATYRLACERLGAEPALSVAVEDSPPGIAAAVAAGLYTIGVPHGLTADLDLGAAHRLVESLEHVTLRDSLAEAARRSA